MNIAEHGLPFINVVKFKKKSTTTTDLLTITNPFYINESSKKQEVIDLPTANIGSTSYLHLSNPNVSDLQYLV